MKKFLSRSRPGEREVPLFSSPYSNLNASPLAARRSSLEERRRPAAKYEQKSVGATANNIGFSHAQETHDEHDEEDEGEEDDNDHAGESSPLLPIFSAEHLGTLPIKQ